MFCEAPTVMIQNLRPPHTDRQQITSSVFCLSGVRGVGGIQLQSRLGGDFVPEGDPERRLCLPGGAQTPPSADLQPVWGHFQEVRQWRAAPPSGNLKPPESLISSHPCVCCCCFRLDGAPSSVTPNVKRLLTHCDDVYGRYRLAYQQNLYDVTKTLLQDAKTSSYLNDRLASWWTDGFTY